MKRHGVCDDCPKHHHLPAEELNCFERTERLWDAQQALRKAEGRGLTLGYLLTQFAGFRSYDPRDAVYAFISMASDVDSSAWVPEYSSANTTIHLYGRVVEHMIKISRRTDMVCTSLS